MKSEEKSVDQNKTLASKIQHFNKEESFDRFIDLKENSKKVAHEKGNNFRDLNKSQVVSVIVIYEALLNSAQGQNYEIPSVNQTHK